MATSVHVDVRVEGIVQGVGFRPFVHALAHRLGVAGEVGNDVAGVFIRVEGSSTVVEEFLRALRAEAPPLAQIEQVTVNRSEPRGLNGFAIVASESAGARQTLVSADSATCADCLAELADPADRRHNYPFINCTNCGPRFTIVRDVPYDRPYTTMSGFPMCRACAAEYHDPENRRFHAQPVCCPDCGPTLSLTDTARRPLNGEPIAGTIELLLAGKVLAIKGLGGYHLAVDATSERASAALRGLKHREDKPFAVMMSTVEDVRESCFLDPTSKQLLTGRRRPIVLLDRRQNTSIAPSVAPGNRQLGVMLPYTPLHHLLLAAFRRPLVLTSGNISDEPIAFTDDDAYDRLGRIADAFLTHDRAIHIRTDDSVTRSFRAAELPVRRSRGYAPEPLSLPWRFPRQVLACGAELKNTFCVAKGSHAFLSHHIGDLENYETLRSFTEGIEHFKRLFDIEPAVVGYDLHPEYLSTKYALQQDELDLVGVQHHHAHIASCLADNKVNGPVLGVAFDGTGYGTDGTIWGGEFLLADLTDFSRQAYFAPVPLPGGARAIKEPWRMAASYVYSALGEPPGRLEVFRRNEKRWHQVTELARGGVNAPPTSSAGRLFDAVAALLDVRDTVNYEGQAAIELEQLADIDERGSYPADVSGAAIPGADVVRCVVEDLLAGVAVPVIAARFHNTMVDVITGVCDRLREVTGVHTVALSGGVFQNLLLLNRSVETLLGNGFAVLTHSRVPCNDGGISLGQAAVVSAKDQAKAP